MSVKNRSICKAKIGNQVVEYDVADEEREFCDHSETKVIYLGQGYIDSIDGLPQNLFQKQLLQHFWKYA